MLSYHRFGKGLRALLLAPAVVVASLVATTERTTSGRVVAVVLLALPAGVALFSGTLLRASGDRLTLGFVPFYVTRLRWDEVAEVAVADVRPFEDFGGWGIKGSSKGAGLLLSAGGSRVVSVRTTDGRRYLLSSEDPAAAVDRLARHSAG
jgi:hypothetical protein